MAKKIFGLASSRSTGSLNFVSAYITQAEKGYRNPTNSTNNTDPENAFVGFLHTISGEGIIETKNGRHVLHANDLIFLKHYEMKMMKTENCEWEFCCIWFYLNNMVLDFENVVNLPFLPNEMNYIRKIIDLLNGDDYYFLCQANGVGLQLLGELLAAVGTVTNKTAYYSDIRDIVFYINQNIAEELSVEDLAKRCNVCVKHFRNMFFRQIGMTPKQYILKVKLEKAAFLLTFTPLSVTEISDELNFFSPAYFIRRFKLYYDMTPLKYRQTH